MRKLKRSNKKLLKGVGFVLVLFFGGFLAFKFVPLVFSFGGPSDSPGVGSGAIGVDAQNNVSFGTSTPTSTAKVLIVGASTSSASFGLLVLNSQGDSVLQARNDGVVALGLSGATVSASGVFNGTIAASNVTAGAFASGNFAFPGALGVGTSTTVGLPASGLYVAGNVGIGTTTPAYKLDVRGGQINASGGLCIAGDCKTAWSSIGQWISATGGIYYASGSVSIGTSDINSSYSLYIGGYSDELLALRRYTHSGPEGSPTILKKNSTGGQFTINNEGLDLLTLTSNVGIGTTTPSSKLHVAGPIATQIRVVDTDSDVLSTDSMIVVDASKGGVRLGLPTAVGIGGREYTIKKVDSSSNAVTIDPYSNQTIDGASTYVLSSRWKYIKIVSDGTNWLVVANN